MKRVWLAALAAAALAIPGCSCAQRTFDPCQANPTYQAPDGQWREADGEPLDDDPCDADDFTGDGDVHTKKTPGPKSSPKGKKAAQ